MSTIDERVEEVLGKMTLEQKCALLSGKTPFGTRDFPDLGVPAMEFSDGPHGLRHQKDGANHLGIGGSDPATCFPTAVTVASSWDVELAGRMGAALGEEARSLGVGVLLGPGLCIKRSPLCGRDFEYFSEDPYLSGKMAAGFVRGVQEKGIAACPKHFAANSQETRRQASDSVLDERTLREIYLRGFEIAVREGRPKSIMSSYNLINGTYASQNRRLLQDVLRGEWGFEGATVTDWGGSVDHVSGVKAGTTFEMPAPGLDSPRELAEAVRSGRLDEHFVDARAREALHLVLESAAALEGADPEFDWDAHHDLARCVAREGVVLLKNEAPAGEGDALLPLRPGTRVALVGDFAQTPRYQGAGSSLVECTRLDTLLDVVGERGELDLLGFEPGFTHDGSDDAACRAAAVSLASGADVCVVCLGLAGGQETEGAERRDMLLPQAQVELLRAVRSCCDRVVVLLSCGCVVDTSWSGDCDALLYLGLGGQAGASAAYDVLTGSANPCGHLAETWPLSLEDTPTAGRYPSDGATAEYREGIYVGYRYYQSAHVPVAFPFGFGLSYTSFELSSARIAQWEQGRPARIEVNVRNTGDRAGATVVQAYVAKPEHEVFRAEQELKGFSRVELEKGESTTVSIDLDPRAFEYYNVGTCSWEVEGGRYELRLGLSCEDVRQTLGAELKGTGAPNPYAGRELPSYGSGCVHEVTCAEFATLLGHAAPNAIAPLGRSTCLRDLNRCRSLILLLVWLVLEGRHRQGLKSGNSPDLDVEFAYNMPLHAIAKMAPPVTMGVVDAIVREARGYGLVGFVPALAIALLAHGGVGVFAVVWLAWVLVPLLGALLVGALRNVTFARKLNLHGKAE